MSDNKRNPRPYNGGGIDDERDRMLSQSQSPSPERKPRGRSRSRSPSYSRSKSRGRRYRSRSRSERRHKAHRHRRRHHRESYSRSPARYRSRSRTPPRRGRYDDDRYNRPKSYSRFRRDPNQPAQPSEVLGVFGLSFETTENDLHEIFQEYGHIQKISLILDHGTGKSRGFGFIYFSAVDEAKLALEKTNGIDIQGKVIRVDYSVTKRPHSPTPGMYMGRKSSNYDRRSSPRARNRSISRSRSGSRS